MLRSPIKRSSRNTGPVCNVVDAVLERGGFSCEICGQGVCGQRGVDWSVHHRVPRQAGGTRAAWVNAPPNLLVVCGSATTGCHGVLESHRAGAVAGGWLILARQNPLYVAALITRDRWKYLTVDGGYADDPPERAA
jgi:hypothetical protein